MAWQHCSSGSGCNKVSSGGSAWTGVASHVRREGEDGVAHGNSWFLTEEAWREVECSRLHAITTAQHCLASPWARLHPTHPLSHRDKPTKICSLTDPNSGIDQSQESAGQVPPKQPGSHWIITHYERTQDKPRGGTLEFGHGEMVASA
ncbi:hypothetical protein JZ751_020894 [Albula glossodonta]|uniref:Uncharacterized protein n=1 Tax=Albula glossodonta TaxID=121402 RepID=A0A8T2PJU9_9TELE|nr:hypothetical protein JZ751_020894 [Albula glossodonta]